LKDDTQNEMKIGTEKVTDINNSCKRRRIMGNKLKIKDMFQEVREFWDEEDGVGVVELILILVVLIGLVLIFKDQLISLVNNIFSKIKSESGKV